MVEERASRVKPSALQEAMVMSESDARDRFRFWGGEGFWAIKRWIW